MNAAKAAFAPLSLLCKAPEMRRRETFFKERVDKFRLVSYNIHVASLVYELNTR